MKGKVIEYAPNEKLNNTLGVNGAYDIPIEEETINKLIIALRYGESIGDITNLIIKYILKDIHISCYKDGEKLLMDFYYRYE